MSKVLLIQPSILTFGGLTSPPLGLLFIGTYLKSRGHEVRILDRNIDFFCYSEMVDFQPDVVGVSTMTGRMLLDAIEISRFVKARWNGRVPVMWGGIHTSLLPEQTLANEYVDYIVVGEGEETSLELVEALERGDSPAGIKGVGYKEDGRCMLNERREFIKDLDALPLLDWSLLNAKAYFRTEIPLVTSRGCPFNCAFCYNQTFNKRRWRGWSAERTLLEIERASALTPNRRLKFYDDNFGANRKRLDAILDGLDKHHHLWLELRIDSIDDALLQKLAKFDSTWIFLGVESGTERMLGRMSKHLTLDMIRDVFRMIGKYERLETTGSIVIGCPGETKAEVLASIRFMEELSPTRQGVCIFAPFPGTQFYNEAVEQKLFTPPATTEDWAMFVANLFSCRDLSSIDDEVRAEVKRLYRRAYARTILNFITRGQLFKFWHKLVDMRSYLIKAFTPVDQWKATRGGKA